MTFGEVFNDVYEIKRWVQMRICVNVQPLVYFPHICNINTEAINSRLITRTGTGPLKQKER